MIIDESAAFCFLWSRSFLSILLCQKYWICRESTD